MSENLVLMGLTTEDFDWYEVGEVDSFSARGIPQIVNELAINNESITVAVISDEVVPDFGTIKVALWFRSTYLPVYENGDFYVKSDGQYATVKRSDGYALLGIRNESSS
ncbi:hypothetical protein HUO09_05430 [Vibrio sp. Y2-5]|uniref:hypothetical protein n=1 Tax=Vibrio sp. Y2-5 TaxID=2743977 RepID=UPI0016613B3D|nr:hypothetical protein [Vibrio sp. Y2-5]MBD0785773.1 hypothetical protein [Vibrio sp. Y2-5]